MKDILKKKIDIYEIVITHLGNPGSETGFHDDTHNLGLQHCTQYAYIPSVVPFYVICLY